MPTTHPQSLMSQIEQNGCLNMFEPEVMINEELHAADSFVRESSRIVKRKASIFLSV
jgi:hypothetical protein